MTFVYSDALDIFVNGQKVFQGDATYFSRATSSQGLFPVVALLHGGCWIGYAGLEDMARLATALTHVGFATWNVEYRRGHEPGGGWPGTFDDAEHGVKALKDLATKFPLDLSHVVLVGHSAGGQLALYVGSRLKRPAISLAGIVDIRAYADLSRSPCVNGELKVMGGTPDQYPDRYAKVSPAQLLPLGIPQILIWGERDNIVPESFFKGYEERADQAEIIRVPGVNHFEFSAAEGPAWEATLAAVSRLIKLSSK